jgi:hypothetical protein
MRKINDECQDQQLFWPRGMSATCMWQAQHARNSPPLAWTHSPCVPPRLLSGTSGCSTKPPCRRHTYCLAGPSGHTQLAHHPTAHTTRCHTHLAQGAGMPAPAAAAAGAAAAWCRCVGVPPAGLRLQMSSVGGHHSALLRAAQCHKTTGWQCCTRCSLWGRQYPLCNHPPQSHGWYKLYGSPVAGSGLLLSKASSTFAPCGSRPGTWVVKAPAADAAAADAPTSVL